MSTPDSAASGVASPDLVQAVDEVLLELLARTENAERVVKRLARDSAVAKSAFAATEPHRLEGKAEGLRVAISYIREAVLRD